MKRSLSERFYDATEPYDKYFSMFRRLVMIACAYVALDVRGIEWALFLGAWLLHDLDTMDTMFRIAKIPTIALIDTVQEMFFGKSPKEAKITKKPKKVPTEGQF